LTVVNEGPDVARNVLVEKGGLPLVRFLSSTASQGDCTTPGDCHVGDIAPGESVTVTHQVTAWGYHDTGRSTVSFAARTETPDRHIFNDYVSLEYTAIQSPNHPPITLDDSYFVAEDNVLAISTPGLLANDIDPDGDELAVTFDAAENGTVTPGAKSGAFTYRPDSDFSGTDSFTYTVDDGRGGRAWATVTITVRSAEELRSDLVDAVQALDELTVGRRRALLVTLRPFGTVEQRLRRLDRFEQRLSRYVQRGLIDVKTAIDLLEDVAALRLAIQ
jgi:hypothetical protein